MKILVRVCDRGHTHCVYMSTSSKIPQFVTCVQAYVEYTIRVFLLPVACLNYCVVQYSSFQMTVCYKFHVQVSHSDAALPPGIITKPLLLSKQPVSSTPKSSDVSFFLFFSISVSNICRREGEHDEAISER